MKSGEKIRYVDIEGRARTLTFIEQVAGYIKWHATRPPSPAGRFMLEDGHVIQVPWDCFEWAKDLGRIKMEAKSQ